MYVCFLKGATNSTVEKMGESIVTKRSLHVLHDYIQSHHSFYDVNSKCTLQGNLHVCHAICCAYVVHKIDAMGRSLATGEFGSVICVIRPCNLRLCFHNDGGFNFVNGW